MKTLSTYTGAMSNRLTFSTLTEPQKETPGWQEREGSSFSHEEFKHSPFHWNLGIATNNQAEAYALYQGLLLAKILNIHSLSVIGDSKIIIGHARKGSHPPNLHLKAILQRISATLKHFPNISLFHVLRRNNQLVDAKKIWPSAWSKAR
jgi:ribonuclease HI